MQIKSMRLGTDTGKKRATLPELFLAKKLNALQISAMVLVLAGIFFLVYSPHFSSPFPLHIDEWYSIQQAMEISNGAFSFGSISNFQLGFDLFLFAIGKAINLILAYQFFPAIWAVISAAVLFFVAYNLTERNFLVSLLSMIFFGSVKSNNNITGLWFFTPLTFAIPFIFLYMFFFAKGLKEEKRKYLLISLGIMLFLVFVHALSVLFAVPILVLACLFNIKFVRKECLTFLLFLLVPAAGILFYSAFMKIGVWHGISEIVTLLQFSKYWAGPFVTVVNNSFTEIYSIMGYALAFSGALYIIAKKRKDFALYLVWPVYLLAAIGYYYLTGMSYLSPYIRNFYFFALGLPLLSALGMNYLFEIISSGIKRISVEGAGKKTMNFIKSGILAVIFSALVFLSYVNYYSPPASGVHSYIVSINSQDYQDLSYLLRFPPGNLVVPPNLMAAAYPVAGKNPVGYLFESQNPSIVADLIELSGTGNCTIRDSILSKYNISYYMTENPVNCNYTVLLSNNQNTIYYVGSSGIKNQSLTSK